MADHFPSSHYTCSHEGDNTLPNDESYKQIKINLDICQSMCTSNPDCRYIFFARSRCQLFKTCENDVHKFHKLYGMTMRKSRTCRNDLFLKNLK